MARSVRLPKSSTSCAGRVEPEVQCRLMPYQLTPRCRAASTTESSSASIARCVTAWNPAARSDNPTRGASAASVVSKVSRRRASAADSGDCDSAHKLPCSSTEGAVPIAFASPPKKTPPTTASPQGRLLTESSMFDWLAAFTCV